MPLTPFFSPVSSLPLPYPLLLFPYLTHLLLLLPSLITSPTPPLPLPSSAHPFPFPFYYSCSLLTLPSRFLPFLTTFPTPSTTTPLLCTLPFYRGPFS